MASAGHSGSHSVQSMHSSGSMVRKFGPSWKQSTGHTSTQSMYLHLMQFSVTTKVMQFPQRTWLVPFAGGRPGVIVGAPGARTRFESGRQGRAFCHASVAKQVEG